MHFYLNFRKKKNQSIRFKSAKLKHLIGQSKSFFLFWMDASGLFLHSSAFNTAPNQSSLFSVFEPLCQLPQCTTVLPTSQYVTMVSPDSIPPLIPFTLSYPSTLVIFTHRIYRTPACLSICCWCTTFATVHCYTYTILLHTV